MKQKVNKIKEMAMGARARKDSNQRMAKTMANRHATINQTLVRLMAMTMTGKTAQKLCETEVRTRTKIKTRSGQKSRLT